MTRRRRPGHFAKRVADKAPRPHSYASSGQGQHPRPARPTNNANAAGSTGHARRTRENPPQKLAVCEQIPVRPILAQGTRSSLQLL